MFLESPEILLEKLETCLGYILFGNNTKQIVLSGNNLNIIPCCLEKQPGEEEEEGSCSGLVRRRRI